MTGALVWNPCCEMGSLGVVADGRRAVEKLTIDINQLGIDVW